jgi:S1-C subfamily serine protease
VSLVASLFPEDRAMDLSENLIGIRVEDLSFQNRSRYNIKIDKGVVINKVLENSYLFEIGVRPGDTILKLAEHVIENVDTYEKMIIKYRLKSSVVLLLQRGDTGYYITVRL